MWLMSGGMSFWNGKLAKVVDILWKTTYNTYTDMNLLHEVH